MIACLRLTPASSESIWPQVLAILADFSPAVEPDPSQAAIYLDLGHFPGPVFLEQAELILLTLQKQLDLLPAIGIAINKFSAYVAAQSINPGRTALISPGCERGFLAQLTVDWLPLEPELARRLHLFGLKTLGQFVKLPPAAVLSQFGFQGRRLHQLAAGIDPRPLAPIPLPPLEQSSRQFDPPTDQHAVIRSQLEQLLAELTQRCQQRGLAIRSMALSLLLIDNNRWQRSIVLPQPTLNPVKLVHICARWLEQANITAEVEAINLQFSDLVLAAGQQLELFAGATQQNRQLEQILLDLIARYGPGYFYTAHLTQGNVLVPEQRFRLDEVG